MKEISFSKFLEENGNPMVAASAVSRDFFKEGPKLGVISERENGSRTASVLEHSPYFDQKRVSESKYFNQHKDREDAEEWLSNNI